jgi:hypothetical protein
MSIIPVNLDFRVKFEFLSLLFKIGFFQQFPIQRKTI